MKIQLIVLASTLLSATATGAPPEAGAGAPLAQILEQAKVDKAKQRFARCARGYLEIAQRNPAVRAPATYNAASCYALGGQRDRAFATLADAVNAGFSDANAMAKDSDLTSLHQDPRWGPLLERARSLPPRNEALQRTLVQMEQEDQDEAQRSYAEAGVRSQRARRQAVLKSILAEFGWPGVRLVGPEGANGAWLVAQHADDDVTFQRTCLELVEQAYHKGDVPGLHLAYLTDRVLVNEHKPQVYGTQGAPVYTEAEKAQVNARRGKLGLPSMAEMAQRKGRFYQEAYRQAAAAKANRRAPDPK